MYYNLNYDAYRYTVLDVEEQFYNEIERFAFPTLIFSGFAGPYTAPTVIPTVFVTTTSNTSPYIKPIIMHTTWMEE
jgi:hypothetical protein